MEVFSLDWVRQIFVLDWVRQIFVFGFTALALFILSQIFIRVKKPGIGFVFAVLELLSASVSSSAWMWALRVSGKGDWLLLGILGYPPIGVIFWSMFVVGIRCAVVSIQGIRRQNELKGSTKA